MKYIESIENIIESIKSNNRTINFLITQIKSNNEKVNRKMLTYSKKNTRLDENQINAYKNYTNEFRHFKELIQNPPEVFIMNDFYNTENTNSITKNLKNVYKKQISFINILCSLIIKANEFLFAFQ